VLWLTLFTLSICWGYSNDMLSVKYNPGLSFLPQENLLQITVWAMYHNWKLKHN